MTERIDVRSILVFIVILMFQIHFSLLEEIIPVKAQAQISDLRNDLKMEEFVQHVFRLSSMPTMEFPSRFTGYPGFYEAADYINETLSNLGYHVEFEYFNITIPRDYGGSLVIMDREQKILEIKAYPLLPNTIQTCFLPKPVRGKLIYGKTSTYSDLNELEIDGNIVLLEYNSRWFWKNAANLGAKAIIFIEPDDTTRIESEFKYLKVPIHIPRLYIKRNDGLKLLSMLNNSDNLDVIVTSRMVWENRLVPNIIATKEGTTLSNEKIVLTAYYDSFSVVPSISPGATDALNVAALLEIARYFSNKTVPRSVVFAFLAGHGQGLWGAREFIDRHFEEVGLTMKLLIDLDLSHESNTLAFYARGTVYTYTQYLESTSFGWISDRLEQYKATLTKLTGRTYRVINGMFFSEPISEYAPLRFNSDPFTLAGGIGVAFHTTDSIRIRQQTPLDFPYYINFANLVPQLEFILTTVVFLANEDTLPSLGVPIRISEDRGFSYVKGILGRYNVTTATYDPFPINNSIVHVQWMESLPSIMQQWGAIAPTGTFDIIIKPSETYVKPDGSTFQNAMFTVKGVKPYSTLIMKAYVLNETTGMIEYATDLGIYGLGKGYPVAPGGTSYWVNPDPSTGIFLQWLPLFKCGSIALYGIIDPSSSARITFSILNYDFAAHSWNLRHSADVFEGDAIVFVPPNKPTELILRLGTGATSIATVTVATGEITRFPLAVLSNITIEKLEGSGYCVPAGQQLIIKNTALEIARQLYLLTKNRREVTSTRHVYSEQIEQFFPVSLEKLEIAENAFRKREYDLGISAAIASWAYARSAYGGSMNLIFDVINTVAFFFLLTIPFCLLLLKLLFPSLFGLKRLLTYAIFFLTVIGILWLFHPGFHVATNVYMILVSSTIGIFAIIVGIRIFNTISEAAEARKRALLGTHFAGLARTGALMMAMSIGIENMRKRKFRTTLTLFSLIILTIAMITLTSGSFLTLVVTTKFKPPQGIPYNGLQIMDPSFAPLAEEMIFILDGLYKSHDAIVVPRTWLASPLGLGFRIEGGTFVQGILGLTPEESILMKVNQTLLVGRWFEEQDMFACILSSSLAKFLNKSIGDKLVWAGLNLTVIGVFDETILSRIRDLNSAIPIAPVSFIETKPQPVSIESTLIVPYRLLIESLNIFPYSISIKFENIDVVPIEAYKLALQTVNLDVYAGFNNEVTVYSPRAWYGISGLNFMAIPFIIVAMTIINVIVASVYERSKEISIYGAVGLNPTHVTGLFLAESTLYAVISAIAGYIASMVILGFLDLLRLVQMGMYFNYASTFVIIVIGLVMSTAMGSTLYPAILAGRLVTPSLTRKWQMPSRPVGDDWHIPLPFSGTLDEASAQLIYLKEFVDASTSTYGRFAADVSSYVGDENIKQLRFIARLAPFDLGITQEVIITAQRKNQKDQTATISMHIHRLTGHNVSWENLNRYFVDQIRKQFLIYRALSPKDKAIYFSRALELEKT